MYLPSVRKGGNPSGQVLARLKFRDVQIMMGERVAEVPSKS